MLRILFFLFHLCINVEKGKKADTHTFLCKFDCALCIGVYARMRSSQRTNVMHAKDFYSRQKERKTILKNIAPQKSDEYKSGMHNGRREEKTFNFFVQNTLQQHRTFVRDHLIYTICRKRSKRTY